MSRRSPCPCAGGLFDTEGFVEFVANYREAGRDGRMRERSRFLRVDGSWLYWGPVVSAR